MANRDICLTSTCGGSWLDFNPVSEEVAKGLKRIFNVIGETAINLLLKGYNAASRKDIHRC